MSDCDLIKLGNGKWWCPAPGCDDGKKRLLPGNYRRNCRSPDAGFSLRRHIDRETAFFVKQGTATQTAAQIAATLDKCFGGCPKFANGCIDFPNECTHHKRWVERLIFNGCEK